MRSSVLQNNLNSILGRYKNISQEKIEKYLPMIEGIQFIQGKNGGRILCKLDSEGKQITLNSKYRPIEEAQKWAKQFQTLQSGSIVLVFGLGSGLFLEQLIQAVKGEMKIIVYEPDPLIFVKVISEINLSHILNDPMVHMSVAGINETDFVYLLQQYVDYQKMNKTVVTCHMKYDTIYTAEYEMFKHKIQDRQFINQVQAHFEIQYADKIRMNISSNMRYLLHSSSIPDCKYISENNLPAVLVSPGPSLSRNIHLLHRVRNRALIIATDTSLRALLRENVIPHMMITVDARKSWRTYAKEGVKDLEATFEKYGIEKVWDEKWFYVMGNKGQEIQEMDKRISDIPMVCNMFSSQFLLNKNRGKKVIYENGYGFAERVYSMAGKQALGLATGGSVATTAFSFLKSIGIRKIILVGQDLAYDGENRYTEGIHFKNVHTAKVDIPIEGIYGNMVYTRKDYYQYLKWFENEIKANANLQVIDATEGGARIKGTIVMTLEEVIQQYCKKQYPIQEMVDGLQDSFTNKQREKITAFLCQTEVRLERIQKDLNKKISHVAIDFEQFEKDLKRRYDPVDIEHIFYYMKEAYYDFHQEDVSMYTEGELEAKNSEWSYTVIKAIDDMQPHVRQMVQWIQEEQHA